MKEGINVKKELNEANEVLNKALDFQNKARKAKENYSYYINAAEEFEKASEYYSSIIKNVSDEEESICAESMEVYAQYYIYESLICKSAYYYEDYNIDEALNLLSLADKKLDEILDSAKELKNADENMLKSIENWKFKKLCNSGSYYSYKGRQNFISEKYVDALDCYRQAVDELEKCVSLAKEKVKNKEFEQVLLRISSGNLFGMYFNTMNSFVGILRGNLINKDSRSQKIKLIELKIDGLDYGEKAFNANPEWEQYSQGIDVFKENLKLMLENNKNLWLEIFEKYKNNYEVISLMRSIDEEKYESLIFKDNKVLKMWGIGGFFLFTFIVIALVVSLIFNKLDFCVSLIVCAIVETVFIIIGAFLLRATGDLSEKGLISLIKLSFKGQFRFILNLLDKQNDNQN